MTTTNPQSPLAVDARLLVFSYPDDTPALRGLSLSVAPGESVCLAGPNGAGKSTLLLVLAGLLRPSGTLLVEGSLPALNRNFGLVFQDPDDQLFCPTVADDVAFGPRNRKLPPDQIRRLLAESLAATGLAGFESRSAHHLSGGEKKRAAIAAVLACRPSILALDEPWTNLDARGSRAVSDILRRFQGTRLVATHDLHHAVEVCSRMVVIDAGAVVADGPMTDLLADKSLLESHGLEFR